ncbi:hypothetical protein ACVFI8_16860 [Agarivorans sp. MS3-6]
MKLLILSFLLMFSRAAYSDIENQFIDSQIGSIFLPVNEKNYFCDYIDNLNFWFIDGYHYSFTWYDSSRADWSEVWPFLKSPHKRVEGDNAEELEKLREIFFSLGKPILMDSSPSHLFFTFEGAESFFVSKSLQHINGSYLVINKRKSNVYSQERCEYIDIDSIIGRIVELKIERVGKIK